MGAGVLDPHIVWRKQLADAVEGSTSKAMVCYYVEDQAYWCAAGLFGGSQRNGQVDWPDLLNFCYFQSIYLVEPPFMP